MDINAEHVEEILELSLDKFRWKTSRQIDQLANLFDDDLLFVHLTGNVISKAEWIDELMRNNLVYDKIEPQEHDARLYGNHMAVLTGKAWFTVNRGDFYKLVYTEVYIKKDSEWKLVNLHTTAYD